jgi:hypothetical protein
MLYIPCHRHNKKKRGVVNYISDVTDGRVGICEPVLTYCLFMEAMQCVLSCVCVCVCVSEMDGYLRISIVILERSQSNVINNICIPLQLMLVNQLHIPLY